MRLFATAASCLSDHPLPENEYLDPAARPPEAH